MKEQGKMLSIYAYLDYRAFLRDWYEAAKRSGKHFSFRAFSKRAGFNSPNFFKLVMDGSRNLTEDSLAKFVMGLKLAKQEAEFFRSLVFFTQAKSHDERDLFYRRLLQSREFSQLKSLEKNQYEYYTTWYHPVIRELIESPGFDGTAEWLARKVHPPIHPDQAEQSLKLLETLKLIRRVGPRRWKQTSTLVTTGPEVASLILMNYHQMILKLARDVLPVIPAAQRDISAVTLGIAKERLPELKKRIQTFRQEILKFVSLDEKPESVVLMSIQLFPLTQPIKG